MSTPDHVSMFISTLSLFHCLCSPPPTPGLVILTDGVLGFSNPSTMHTAVNQMRGANISCWVVQVGGAPEPEAAFGLMPDVETLWFMSLACNGCVIQPEKVG